MTTPKFTPDPAPEGLDPPLAEWLQRQLNRIEDWWPKDLEERVNALEFLFPYMTGTWPMIGYSSVQLTAGYEVAPVYESVGFLYSDPGSGAHLTEGDYLSFNPSAIPISGFSSADVVVDNKVGQVLSWKTPSGLWTTEDGENWTSRSIAGMGYIQGAVWFKGEWYAVGKVGTWGTSGGNGFCCYKSPDGATWTQLHENVDNSVFVPEFLHAIDTDGVTLVVSGVQASTGNNRIATSTDGATWNYPAAVPNVEPARKIFYRGGLWFLCCLGGRLYSSTDLVTWTQRLAIGGITTDVVQIEHGDGRFFLANDFNTTLYTSTDGFTWSPSSLAVPAVTGGWPLNFDSTYGWLFCSSTIAKYSTDGTTWNNTNLGASLGFSARIMLRMNIAL